MRERQLLPFRSMKLAELVEREQERQLWHYQAHLAVPSPYNLRPFPMRLDNQKYSPKVDKMVRIPAELILADLRKEKLHHHHQSRRLHLLRPPMMGHREFVAADFDKDCPEDLRPRIPAAAE
jgi:hypothetical protein